MPESYYLVELRCGTCGLIFASSRDPLAPAQADDMEKFFLARGPERYRQCKNRCTRKHPLLNLPETRESGPMNYNQQVLRTVVPYAELKARGLAS